MKIKNKTRWRTDQLRAIIHRVAKNEMVSLAGAVFTIVKRHQSNRWSPNYAGGCAYYRMPPLVTIKMPDPGYGINKAELAKVIAHELAHCQGVRHNGMPKNGSYRWGGDWKTLYAWADAMPLEAAPEPIKIIPTKQEVIEKKRKHAEGKMEIWHHKMGIAKSRFRKWERKMVYYNRQLEKAAVQPPSQEGGCK